MTKKEICAGLDLGQAALNMEGSGVDCSGQSIGFLSYGQLALLFVVIIVMP